MSRLPQRWRRGAGRPLHMSLPLALGEALTEGAAPLAPGAGDALAADTLRVAFVVPPFRRGSGGHATIANLVRGLERQGHACSLWILDDEQRHAGRGAAGIAADFTAWFGPVAGPIHDGVAEWDAADVALATGWQTVPTVLRLPGIHARGYLVQDHEPEFYATSAEREWATWTYAQGLHHIAASPWLADLLRTRYDASADAFTLGVDHERYRPPIENRRRDDVVLLYARAVTPRRAVPLGVLALAELARRRPGVELRLFGEARPLELPFAAQQLGVLPASALAREYGEATIGVVLSMTNPSLIPLEMFACGLPVVDLASASMTAEFGDDGPPVLSAFDPIALASILERLLDDPDERRTRSLQGLQHVAPRTWEAAAAQVGHGLREALRRHA